MRSEGSRADKVDRQPPCEKYRLRRYHRLIPRRSILGTGMFIRGQCQRPIPPSRVDIA